MSSSQEKRKLPLWAKLLSTLVVLVFTSTIAGMFSVFVYAQRLAKDSQDPVYIKNTAAKIAQFPDPLPAGFEMKVAADVPFGFDTVLVEHSPDQQAISFFAARSVASDDPKELLDRAYSLGINAPLSYSAKFQEVKSKGSESIAGQEMNYIVGRYRDSAGRTGDGMIACIVVKRLSKNILIYAFQKSDTPYNQDTTLNFIRSIKGF